MYFPEVIQSLVKYLRYSFFEIVNDFQPSTIFAKSSILYVCQGLEYASAVTNIKPLSPNPTKWSKTLKQLVGNLRRIVWACLTILCDWHLKGLTLLFYGNFKWFKGLFLVSEYFLMKF